MRRLLIQTWQRNHAPTAPPFPTVEALRERLRPAVELTEAALARLVLRVRARYPITLPLREDAEVTGLVTWLREAGAVVGPTLPAPESTPSSGQTLPVHAGNGVSDASPPPSQESNRTISTTFQSRHGCEASPAGPD